MKLYDVPRNSKVRVVGDSSAPPAARVAFDGEVINFKHIDGAYSYCTDSKGTPIHLPAWQEVEIVQT